MSGADLHKEAVFLDEWSERIKQTIKIASVSKGVRVQVKQRGKNKWKKTQHSLC